MLDTAIVGGEVVDGTGGPARQVDVGTEAGRIVAVVERGALPEARHTIDATGKLVTPGFIDPHTHMDAQLWWDPSGSPSVLHGVTSVVIGSCGFGVAPVAPGLEEYMLKSLESVEEIPYASTRLALPMNWPTWPAYFEALGELPLGINVASFVPHSALRVGTLGERGQEGPLNPAELDRLAGALRDSLASGAVGVSTSRGTNHTDATGRPMPSRLASDEEIERLVAECGGRIWQVNIAAKGATTPEGRAAAMRELETYAEWSRRHECVSTWTPLVVAPGDKTTWRALLEFSSDRREFLLPQVSAQPMSGSISFDGPSYASMMEGWSEAFAGYGNMDPTAQLSRLRDEGFRQALASAPEDCTRITSVCYDRWTVLVSPTAPWAVGLSLVELGARMGEHPAIAMVDLAIVDSLGTVVGAALSNVDDDAVRVLVAHPDTLIGMGDAGAHIKSINNYSYPTYVLSLLVRDRKWLTLPEAVHRMTEQPAKAFGLADRGTVMPGSYADLCVIDLEGLTVEPATMVKDIPGGSGRLHCGATGFDAVLVNGDVVVDHDVPTRRASGELLRAG